MSIKGTRLDPTDTGTLRPDIAPLQNLGTQFQPLNCPQFDLQVILVGNWTERLLNRAVGNAGSLFAKRMVGLINIT